MLADSKGWVMKKAYVLLLILAVSLSSHGCVSSPAKLRKSAPDLIYLSQKSAKEVAICISDKWENSGSVNQRETKKGYSLTTGKPNYLADIERTESGSRTKVYRYMVIAIGGDPHYDSVSLCQ